MAVGGYTERVLIRYDRKPPRAIALCVSWTGLAEEQAQAIIIVECSPEFATADAVARRAVVAQHVQGHAAD